MTYQGSGHQTDLDDPPHTIRFVTSGLKPDLTVLMDAATKTGLQRGSSEDEKGNRLDVNEAIFHQSVSDGYHKMAVSQVSLLFRPAQHPLLYPQKLSQLWQKRILPENQSIQLEKNV